MALTVKVQLSLETSESEQQVLIYNRTKTIVHQQAVTEDVKEIMQGELKKYFRAHLVQDPEVLGGKRIVLDEEVEAESW